MMYPRMLSVSLARALAILLVAVALPIPFGVRTEAVFAAKSNLRVPSVVAAKSPDSAIAFERNSGQCDERVDYVARASGSAVFLRGSESVLAFGNESGRASIRMSFEGARGDVQLDGEQPLAGTSNYLRGNNPTAWVTSIDRFASVRATKVYDGVDVVHHSANGELEYDVVVSPWADPSKVVMAFDGARRVRLSTDGDLVLETALRSVVHRRPVAYQEIDGKRVAIPCAFEIVRRDRVRFALGAFDRSHALVIDPTVVYSSFLGGANVDRAQAIGIDAAGNTYVAGRTFSIDFPSIGGVQPMRAGDYDVFVTKFDATGSTIVYSTFLGGAGFDEALALDVTPGGEVVVGGDTSSTDFPKVAPFQSDFGGGIDGFVARLAASGASLVFSSFCGGFTTETIEAVAVDGAGITSFGGSSASDTTFPLVAPLQGTYGGGSTDGIYGRISAGGALMNSSFIGGNGNDLVHGIAVDSSGNVYMTGRTQGGGFPTVNPFQAAALGIDAFATKVASDFLSLNYSSFLGGSSEDAGTAIAVDAAGSAYLTGYTSSSNFPTLNPFQATHGGGFDAFVTKVNPAGSGREYSSYLGGDIEDRGWGIDVDDTGSVVVVGQSRSLNFPVVSPSQAINGGNLLHDAFVTRVGATGRQLVYSTYLGGSSTEVAYGVAIDSLRTSYVAGYTSSESFPVVGAEQPNLGGVDDAFVTRIAEAGDTPGIAFQGAAPPAWFLRNAQSAGPADITLSYGATNPAWMPISGDWDGNGTDTPGLYNPATGSFFLRNSNSNGPANIIFSFGSPMIYLPIAGDWNGDGVDTVGIFRPTTGVFFLKNTNGPGPSDHGFTFGVGGAVIPVAGDWDGNGSDSIGFYDPASGTWFLRNSLSNGPANLTFSYGPPGLVAITGDWNGDGIDTPGIYDPANGNWFLINTNGPGPADVVFGFGAGGGTPIAGDWNG